MEVHHLEIFNRPQAIENSRQHLLLHFTENSRWVPLILDRTQKRRAVLQPTNVLTKSRNDLQ